MKTRIDKYFFLEELECSCGCGTMPTDSAIDGLTALRRLYGAIAVTSGARCKVHNKEVGGADSSRHFINRDAFDVKIKSHKDIPRFIYLSWICGFRGFGIIDFKNAILHIDMRENSTMWQYHK